MADSTEPADRLSELVKVRRQLRTEDAREWIALMIADGNLDEAMRECRTLEKEIPRDEHALCGKALVHMCRGQLDEALKCAYGVLGARPGAAYPYGIAGMIMEDRERFYEALCCYERMLAMNPGEAPAYVRKAQLFRFIDRELECQQAIKECLAAPLSGRESPKEKRRLREMGDAVKAGVPARLEAGDSGTFLPGLWEMIDVALGPDPGWAVPGPHGEPDFDGATLVGRGDLKKYLAITDDYIKRHPYASDGWCTKGSLLIEDGRPGEAVACYDRSIELDPGETLAYSSKAELLVNAGEQNGALECLRVGIGVKPNDQSCAGLQENMRQVFKHVESGEPWPNVQSFSIMPNLIRWAAQRRSAPRRFVGWPVRDRGDPVLPSAHGGAESRKPGRAAIRTG